MRKASVVIPVYNAESAIVRCVESIVFGRLKDIEVILVDDCSTDSSWEICQDLAHKYANVSSIRNKRNSGVSYTRNRGMKKATGEYILFVDSDDWVSGRYAEMLIETAESFPDKLVICGMKFINEVDNYITDYIWEKGGKSKYIVERDSFFELHKRFYIQQPVNKAFKRSIVLENNIRFDENQSMGEDFQFVLDYMEAAKIESCVAINEVLYFYIRANTTSLMSKFGLIENENDKKRLQQLLRIAGEDDIRNKSLYLEALQHSKNNAVYHIVRAVKLPREEKLSMIENIMEDGKAKVYLRKQQILWNREKAAKSVQWLKNLVPRAMNRIRGMWLKHYVLQQKKKISEGDFTVISQNCIGGVLYHDLGMNFASPTINLFVSGSDFVKMVLNLEYYLQQELRMSWGEEYPIGYLDDVTIFFQHYTTCSEAKEKWEKRLKRIHWDKIIIFCTDMEGFTEDDFSEWKKITFPKLLFTAHEYKDSSVVYYPEYSADGKVPNLIPKREYYKGGKLVSALNALLKQ